MIIPVALSVSVANSTFPADRSTVSLWMGPLGCCLLQTSRALYFTTTSPLGSGLPL